MTTIKIPEVGEVYERWDGETVQVAGLVYDDAGNLCVEYDIHDLPGQIAPLDVWLGIERNRPFPHPRTFLPVDVFEPEEALALDHDVERDEKVEALERALNSQEAEEPPTIRSVGDEDER